MENRCSWLSHLESGLRVCSRRSSQSWAQGWRRRCVATRVLYLSNRRHKVGSPAGRLEQGDVQRSRRPGTVPGQLGAHREVFKEGRVRKTASSCVRGVEMAQPNKLSDTDAQGRPLRSYSLVASQLRR